MSVEKITIPLDADTARIYLNASLEEQRKLRLLLSLWLREFAISPVPLTIVMDQISEKARARGLTPEVVESLLHAD
jgi:hypothetical protein